MAKYLVRVHMERISGEVEKVPMTFHTEAEAEAFIKSALLADCVLAAERAWRSTGLCCDELAQRSDGGSVGQHDPDARCV